MSQYQIPRRDQDDNEATRRVTFAEAMSGVTQFSQSEDRADLFTALAAAQGEMAEAARTEENTFFKSKYADLAAVRSVTRPALAAHGLALTSWPAGKGSALTLVVTLAHKSGQWMRSEFPIDQPLHEPQKIVSTITYWRRCAEKSICGIADDDDDGNTANGRGPNHEPQRRRRDEDVRPRDQRPSRPAQAPGEAVKTASTGRPSYTAWLAAAVAEVNADWQLELIDLGVPLGRRPEFTDARKAENGIATQAIALDYLDAVEVAKADNPTKRDRHKVREAAEWLYASCPDQFTEAWESYRMAKAERLRAEDATQQAKSDQTASN